MQAQRKKQSQKAAELEILHLLKNANIVARRTPKAHGIAKPKVNNSEHVANCTTTQACANLRHACTLRQNEIAFHEKYDYDSDEIYSSDVSQTEYALTLTLTDELTVNTIDGQHPNRIYARMKVAAWTKNTIPIGHRSYLQRPKES